MTDSKEAVDKKDVQKIPKRDIVDFWQDEIISARHRLKKFFDQAENTEKVYRGEYYGGQHFNILWANTEVLTGAVYALPPKPEVQRRHLEKNPVAATAARIIERGLEFAIDSDIDSVDDVLERVRDDFILSGRGISRVFYEAETRVIGKNKKDEDGNFLPESEWTDIEEKTNERTWVEYWNYRDFLHSDGQIWKDVWWVAFSSNMSKHDIRERFGAKVAGELKYCGEVDPRNKNDNGEQKYEERTYARVHEIWDKRTRMVYWIAEGHDKFLEKPVDDPYGLEGFFPCPRPIDSVFTNNTLVPIPEYVVYQDLAIELNEITKRIFHLTAALKVRGVYPSDVTSIGQMLEGEENELIPDENFAKIAQFGDLRQIVQFLPVEQIAQVVMYLIQLRESTLNTIYQVTGISDILRGATHPRETAEAQRLKGQWGSQRVQKRQKKFEKFIREILRIMAELMAEHYDPEMLFIVAGVSPNEIKQEGMAEVVKLLRQEKIRDMRIRIETNSTIFQDAMQEKQDVVEFLGAMSQFAPQMAMAAKQGIIPPEAAKEIMLASARRFEFGREIEETLMAFNAQGSQQPDPKEQAEMMKIKNEQMKLQLEAKKNEAAHKAKMIELMIKLQELQTKTDIAQADAMIKVMIAEINKDAMIEQAKLGPKGGGDSD